VTNVSLAQSYLLKARSRLKILQVLLDEGAYSDVVRICVNTKPRSDARIQAFDQFQTSTCREAAARRARLD
jgi:hypothetical protein